MEIQAPAEDYLKGLVCYPHFNKDIYSKRLTELHQLGVREVLSQGPFGFSRWSILGKGHVGVVATAKREGRLVALKSLRVDADRPSMEREAEFLAYANMLGVGPRLIVSSASFLISELVRGEWLGRWLEQHPRPLGGRRWIRTLLFQAFKLDVAGLDHGELSRAANHVLLRIKGDPVILDFESSSFSRRCNNLSSLIHYLFIRRQHKEDALENDHPSLDVGKLLLALRTYRTKRSIEQFRHVLTTLRLDS